MSQEGSNYRTSDLYFAAFLKTAGVPLVGTSREGRVVFFLFEDQGAPAMGSLKTQYFMDQAKVPALSYTQAIKSLKVLIFSEGR